VSLINCLHASGEVLQTFGELTVYGQTCVYNSHSKDEWLAFL